MGKDRTVKIIGGLIAGMVAHKILEKYTNRKESLNHLRSEVDNYRDNLGEFVNEYNWNDEDKRIIKEESLKDIALELKKPHFSDVMFPKEEVTKLLNEIIGEILG